LTQAGQLFEFFQLARSTSNTSDVELLDFNLPLGRAIYILRTVGISCETLSWGATLHV
jgi:hypothetical protein